MNIEINIPARWEWGLDGSAGEMGSEWGPDGSRARLGQDVAR